MLSDDAATPDRYYKTLLDALPLPIFVVDDDMRILDFNNAASSLLVDSRGMVLHKRSGEGLHCIHSTDVPEGCGHGPDCSSCILRSSVRECLIGKRVYREKTQVELMVSGIVNEIDMLVTATPIPGQPHRALLILEDVSELNKLRTLIPMCAHCRRIRNDEQYWESVEIYFKKQLGMNVSHGLCQECLKELYPEHSEKILERIRQQATDRP
jgi:hypothetical protein